MPNAAKSPAKSLPLCGSDAPLLILGAFEPELEPLRRDAPQHPGLRFAAVGVGLAAAAAGTAAAICSIRPGHVLFIGSAGAVDPKTPLLTSVIFTRVHLAAEGVIEGSAYQPAPLRDVCSADSEWSNSLHSMLVPAPQLGAAYTPLAITRETARAQRFATAFHSYFENLELFGVAEACAQHGVTWSALAVVTNTVCPEGHEQWKTHFRSAAERTSALLLPHLLHRTDESFNGLVEERSK